MPSLASANYHGMLIGTFSIAPPPPSYVRASRELPPLPEQSSDAPITGNSRNLTPTTTAKQEGLMAKVPEDLDNPYDARSPFLKLFGRVNSLRNLQDDWNSYGAAAPNKRARFWARRVLDELVGLNFAPLTVTASSDEGVAIFFRSEGKRASIECLNSGEILGVLSQGSEAPEVLLISQSHLKRAVSTIQTFLTT